MDSELTSYEAALRDLLSEREEIDLLIDGMKRRIDRVSGGSSTAQTTGNGKSIPDDAFFGLKLAEAAKKYLAIVKQPKATPEIAEALMAGGYKHSSVDFNKTIRSVLNTSPEFLRVNDKWGLVEWYPGAKRSKLGRLQSEEGKQLKATPKLSKPVKNNGELILEFLGKHPDRLYSAEAIAEGIGSENVASIRSLLSQLANKAKIGKGKPSGYCAIGISID